MGYQELNVNNCVNIEIKRIPYYMYMPLILEPSTPGKRCVSKYSKYKNSIGAYTKGMYNQFVFNVFNTSDCNGKSLSELWISVLNYSRKMWSNPNIFSIPEGGIFGSEVCREIGTSPYQSDMREVALKGLKEIFNVSFNNFNDDDLYSFYMCDSVQSKLKESKDVVSSNEVNFEYLYRSYTSDNPQSRLNDITAKHYVV